MAELETSLAENKVSSWDNIFNFQACYVSHAVSTCVGSRKFSNIW